MPANRRRPRALGINDNNSINRVLNKSPDHKKETAGVAQERTFSIIKPDAVARNSIGEILARYERNGLSIVACKLVRFSREQAEAVYRVHRDRSFFGEIIEFMTSGPVFVSVLEGDNAVRRHREIMGATDPKKAATGTVRADFGESLSRNAVHGSDSVESAIYEIGCVFQEDEILSRHSVQHAEPLRTAVGL